MIRHYYNEFDPRAAAWLRELMQEGYPSENKPFKKTDWDASR